MRGHISIDIPTKRYIKAYITALHGETPVMNNDHLIGSKLMDLLEHKTNECSTRFPRHYYNSMIRVRISHYVFTHRGCNLNETNVWNFNKFVQHLVKDKVRFLLDVYIEQTGSFTTALDIVRMRLKIDEDDWDTDTIKKDYWRYRKKSGLPLLYKKSLLQVSLLKSA